MTARVVPIAYVTKYAETRGIIVVRGAVTDAPTVGYLTVGKTVYGPKDWTEDLVKAQHRYVANLRRALTNTQKRAKALSEKLAARTPPLEDKP